MIQHRERLNQFIDYSGLMFGSIHPTDTDGEIEYHNKAWVFFEIKHRDTSFSLIFIVIHLCYP